MTPDTQVLMALARIATGANSHDIGEFTSQYKHACEMNRTDVAVRWERAFSAFLSGRITPLRKAVAEVFFNNNPPMYPNRNWWNEGE